VCRSDEVTPKETERRKREGGKEKDGRRKSSKNIKHKLTRWQNGLLKRKATTKQVSNAQRERESGRGGRIEASLGIQIRIESESWPSRQQQQQQLECQ